MLQSESPGWTTYVLALEPVVAVPAVPVPAVPVPAVPVPAVPVAAAAGPTTGRATTPVDDGGDCGCAKEGVDAVPLAGGKPVTLEAVAAPAPVESATERGKTTRIAVAMRAAMRSLNRAPSTGPASRAQTRRTTEALSGQQQLNHAVHPRMLRASTISPGATEPNRPAGPNTGVPTAIHNAPGTATKTTIAETPPANTSTRCPRVS
jgi:hypothetical protein